MTGLRARLQGGGVVVGTMVFEFTSPGLPRIIADSGADFVVYDMEHSGLTWEPLRWQLMLCREIGLPALVRPPAALPHLMTRALDLGAAGLKVPNVTGPDMARAVTAATRYPPQGTRGSAFGLAHDGYRAGDPASAMAAANAGLVTLAQIESAEGLAAVADTMAVPGMDVAWLGHGDLAASLGMPGDYASVAFRDVLRRIVEGAGSAGKPAGFFASSADAARRWIDLGFRVVLFGRDTGLYASALSAGVNAVKAMR